MKHQSKLAQARKNARAKAKQPKPTLDEIISDMGLDDEMLLKMDGHDDACIGIGHTPGQPARLVYDRRKLIRGLMKMGMTEEEATEFHYFNQDGAYVGERTPIILDRLG